MRKYRPETFLGESRQERRPPRLRQPGRSL